MFLECGTPLENLCNKFRYIIYIVEPRGITTNRGALTWYRPPWTIFRFLYLDEQLADIHRWKKLNQRWSARNEDVEVL